MERLRNFVKCLILLFLLLVAGSNAFCDEIYSYGESPSSVYNQTISTLVTPQNVTFSTCTKEFALNQELLYYLAIAAINANRFEVQELQSKTGYILFKAVNKEFLASVVKLGVNKSMLKITPTNNNYYFPPGIVLNIFKYIDLNLNESIKTINKL